MYPGWFVIKYKHTKKISGPVRVLKGLNGHSNLHKLMLTHWLWHWRRRTGRPRGRGEKTDQPRITIQPQKNDVKKYQFDSNQPNQGHIWIQCIMSNHWAMKSSLWLVETFLEGDYINSVSVRYQRPGHMWRFYLTDLGNLYTSV